jgi:PIN domain nuclease of toxin-antitoxin system
MKVLLDTHTALWMVNEHEKLSLSAKALLLNDECALFISVVSFWEMAIKVSLGKLSELDGGVGVFISQMDNMPIEVLPITTDHLKIVESLPFIHRDPFDRMLVAIATTNDMTILTADSNIPKYYAKCIW